MRFLGRRGANSSNQRKRGECNETKHREDYARLSQIANRNLSPDRNASWIGRTDLPRMAKAVLVRAEAYGADEH